MKHLYILALSKLKPKLISVLQIHVRLYCNITAVRKYDIDITR